MELILWIAFIAPQRTYTRYSKAPRSPICQLSSPPGSNSSSTSRPRRCSASPFHPRCSRAPTRRSSEYPLFALSAHFNRSVECALSGAQSGHRGTHYQNVPSLGALRAPQSYSSVIVTIRLAVALAIGGAVGGGG